MTINVPGPLALALKAAGTVALVYVVFKEAPPMYRYLFKFEAM
jgi:hypothetical protein